MHKNLQRDQFLGMFKRKLLFIGVFFVITPVVLISSAVSLLALNKDANISMHNSNILEYPQSGVQVYASLPDNYPQVSSQVVGADARTQLVKNYLEEYNSPLVEYSGFIVETADKYKLDYRLITAIAQQESNLCKKIPEDSHNCWGWGIHSRGSLGFNSYPEAIETVSKGLKEEYVDKGYTNPDEIMKKYTPLSPGTWARGVNQFMTQMR